MFGAFIIFYDPLNHGKEVSMKKNLQRRSFYLFCKKIPKEKDKRIYIYLDCYFFV